MNCRRIRSNILKKFFQKIGDILIFPFLFVRNIYWENILLNRFKNFANKTKNNVYIFQYQFLDMQGENCFNGGAERYVVDLANILVNRGYNPILVQASSKNNKFWIKQYGSLTVVGLYKHCYFDILSNLPKPVFSIYSGLFKWGKKKLNPNIIISHGVTWDSPDVNFSYKDLVSHFLSNVDYFVSVDTNTISQMRTFFKNQLNNRHVNFMCVPNYVDKKVFCPKKKSHDKIKILFPRRCSVERGFWLVSDVLPEILEQYPFVEFEFVGFIHDEDIKAKLGALIDLYPERVKHLLLEPEHMPDCYKNADITLIPTIYSEGTSLSCLEAMACGNFVIATNIGGLTNLIINNYNGILINPDKNELKQALKNALEDKSFFECVCNNAQSVSDTFEKRVWIQQWNDIITSIGDKCE